MKTTKPDLNNLVNEVTVTYKRKINFDDTLKIQSSQNAERVLRTIFENDTRTEGRMDTSECFIALLISRASKVIGYQFISMGSSSEVVVDLKMILRGMLYSNAESAILCHNHPSGNLKPSVYDKTLTKRVVEAAKILELQVVDQIIITSESYFSFAVNGEM